MARLLFRRVGPEDTEQTVAAHRPRERQIGDQSDLLLMAAQASKLVPIFIDANVTQSGNPDYAHALILNRSSAVFKGRVWKSVPVPGIEMVIE